MDEVVESHSWEAILGFTISKQPRFYQGQRHGLSFWFIDQEFFGGAMFGHATRQAQGFGIFVEDGKISSIDAAENKEGEVPTTGLCTIPPLDVGDTKYFLKVHYSELCVRFLLQTNSW